MRIGYYSNIILLLLISSRLFAQDIEKIPNSNNINLRNLTTDDGLSHNYVFSICQDQQGCIWTGTLGGVNRFDSRNFLSFYNIPDDTSSLGSNIVREIIFGKKNKILVATSEGLCAIDIQTRKTQRITQIKRGTSSKVSSYSIIEDLNGNYWLGAWSNRLYFLNNKNNKVEKFQLDSSGKSETILTMLLDSDNNLWIGTRGAGLFFFNTKTKKYIQYEIPGDDRFKNLNNSISKIIESKNPKILICTNNGLKEFDRTDKTFRNIIILNKKRENLLKNRICNSITKDHHNYFWIGTDSGLIVSNASLTIGKRLLPDAQNKQGIMSANIQTVFTDKHDNVWIGSFNGLSIFNRYINQFQYTSFISPLNEPQGSLALTTLQEGANNKIWVKLNNEYGLLSNTGDIDLKNKNEIFKNHQNELMVCDKKGNCFLNSINKEGVYWRPAGSNGFRRLKNTPQDSLGLAQDWVIKIFRDSRDNVWFLTEKRGISKFNPNTGKFINYLSNPNNPTTINNNYLFNIHEDKSKNLWFATWDGLARYNPKEDNFKRYLSGLIFSICETSNGNFWLGTSNGLVNFNPRTGEIIEHYNKNNGLADNIIHYVLADNHNNLWLSSSKGISKFNIKTKAVSNFDKSDGLHDNEFLRIAATKSANGFLYFSGRFGITYFHPDSIETDPHISKVILTGINIFNKPVQEYPNIRFSRNNSGITELHLNHNYNFIIIDFAVPNFVHPEKCQFRYKLENFDQNWHTVQNQNNANYTNLPPGKYTFKILASNNQGIWGDKLTSLYIEIKPPFWQLWWFRLLLIVIIISAIYLGYVIKLRLIQKRQDELERLIQERTSELIERNNKIDKQAQELDEYSKNLKLNNDLLVEKQTYIKNQAEQLRIQNEQLKILNSTKDKFFSIIAHDLKNPFNIIIGFSDLLIRSMDRLSKEKKALYLQNIYNSSKAANSLLENLLFWSRSQTGSIQYEPSFINIHSLVKETLILFQSDTQKKRIQVSANISANTLVYADENMLKTIIRNLISNAVKFTFEDGSITISSTLNEKEAVISIADSGIGISQENQKLLFDINTNFSTYGTSKESGTGLGLILCKEFVEKNNGKIWVESEEGKGSKFIFTLPVEA